MQRFGHFAVALIGFTVVGSSGSLAATHCTNPNAVGISRTISVAPAGFPLVGKEQYLETLPLQDREIVITFDDGPIPATTPKILEALAAECVKATFFMLGMNVAEAPDLARRAYDEGHTIGTHTFSHPMLAKMSPAKAKADISLGIEAVSEALGPKRILSPFFRAPYLSINKDIERYVLSRGLMIWSIDADSLDWTFTTPDKMIERTLAELERVGRGMLLMHDIKPVTARALPALLQELRRREFRVVHVVPTPPTQSMNTSSMNSTPTKGPL